MSIREQINELNLEIQRRIELFEKETNLQVYQVDIKHEIDTHGDKALFYTVVNALIK